MTKTTRHYRSRALARIERGIDESGAVEIGEVSDRLQQSGPLYLLMAVACVAVSPLSGIPFVTMACGLTIVGLSLQLLLGRQTVWLPGPIRRRVVQLDRLRAGLDRADRVAGPIESTLKRRLTWLTRGPVRAALLCICVALGLTMPFLEIVPFAGTTLASVVLMISLALIARDGLAALVAALVFCVFVGIAIFVFG